MFRLRGLAALCLALLTAVPALADDPLRNAVFVPNVAAFSPRGQATLAASTTSSSVALTAGVTAEVTNSGTVTAYLAFGAAGVTATTAGYPVPAGATVPIDVSSATYIAAITASGSATLAITTGYGQGYAISPAGSGGGGGGGAITAASGAYASGSLATGAGVDGWNLTEGAKSDSAWTTGSGSIVAVLKALDRDTLAPLAAGTNAIGSLNAAAKGQTSALATSLTLKSAAGVLYSYNVTPDATLSAAAWYILIFDATAVPSNGAVTPAKCYAEPAGQPRDGGTFSAGGVAFSTGITIAVSTTGCFTLTQSAHAFISGDYQ